MRLAVKFLFLSALAFGLDHAFLAPYRYASQVEAMVARPVSPTELVHRTGQLPEGAEFGDLSR